ncbi:MAG: hypothetical protein LH478_00340 [Chitinophagaceae bacterium]|nr:hypothetical protein [Chitinophagaceae bacterium]
MMKNVRVAMVLLVLGMQAKAQYYYLDVVGTQQTNDQFKKISQQHLSSISATSFEQNNEPSSDFVLEQTISNNLIVTRSASVNSKESFFKSYYNNQQLIKTIDSNNSAINTVDYKYNNEGKILSTTSSNKDFDGTFDQLEVHQWLYENPGRPLRMFKIKNNADTTIIEFKNDEAGNVIEENWKKNNRIVETYYYYYNSKNQLTDIVRYNRKARQMLPDFMFEYDASGLVSQMIQTQGTSANYLIWRYVYNTKGLKEKEFAFNKKKELLGKMEYSYR